MCHVFVFAGARVILIACTQVTVLISGGYIEVTDFQFMFEYALGIIGQNFSLEVTIPDNTTSLHKVLDSSLTIAQPQEELQVKKQRDSKDPGTGRNTILFALTSACRC
jgi:hypothetical protein